MSIAFIATTRLTPHRRIHASGRAAIIDATYAAFVKSARGRRVMKELKAIKAGIVSDIRVRETVALGKSRTLDASLHLQLCIERLLTGPGTVDDLGEVHSWLGHMLYCCIRRRKHYKPGNIERAHLDHAIRTICAGRRAGLSAWLRHLRLGKMGFAGKEIQPFKQGCAEGFFVSERISASELRVAYRFAADKCRRQGLTKKASDYRYL